MAKAEPKTARANEPARPTTEVHGDGTQIVRHHLGLTIAEEVFVRMAEAIVISPSSDELTYEEIRDRAEAQADVITARINELRARAGGAS